MALRPSEPRLHMGVDCRSLEQPRTGIGRYLENILRELGALCPESRIQLYGMGLQVQDPALGLPPFEWCQVGFEHPAQAHLFAAQLEREPPAVFFSPLYDLPDPIVVPCVATVHDLVHEATPEAFLPIMLDYLYKAHQHTFRRADRIITVSHFSAGELLRHPEVRAERLRVAHNAVDPRFLAATPPPVETSATSNYLLYVGAISAKRHVNELIQAFLASSHLTGLGMRLMLVGPDHQRDSSRMHQLLEQAGERVSYLPYVSNEELLALYQGARGFVYLSRYEGFGMPPLEAAACGVPVMAARHTALPEVLGKASLWIDQPDCVTSIQKGLERLCSDGPLRQALRQAGLEQSRRFSWRDSAQITLQCLQEAARLRA